MSSDEDEIESDDQKSDVEPLRPTDDCSHLSADSSDENSDPKALETDNDSTDSMSSDEDVSANGSTASNPAPTAANSQVLTTSCSPNGNNKCYICLNRFSGQDIGSPESCADIHHFCLECIEEWSKQINTCPVDRKIFTYIAVRREIGSTIIMKLPIVKNMVPDIEVVPEDVTYCEICGRCDREDRLLLCDGCDFGYHCECLSPPLETIPIEEWFCPDCYHRLFGPVTSTAHRTPGAGPSMLNRRRAIARTGASEAVRQRILQRRTQPTRKPVRRKTTKRKRIKRKTTKRKSTKLRKTIKSGVKTKRRKRRTKKRRKKKTKKSAFASRRLPAPADPRSRIASKLGIGPPPKSPFGLPSMKNVSNESVRRLTDLRAAAGISHLSLFGSELDVYDPRIQTFDDEDDLYSTQSDGAVGLMARSRVAARLMSSPSKRKTDLIQNLVNSETNGTSSVDLLSQIMSSQTILHSSARDVRIARDGSLHLKCDANGLPVRNCGNSGHSSPARSPTSSSPGRSPPTSSPQRTDQSPGAQTSNFNYSFGSASNSRSNSSANNNSTYGFGEDISAVKPVLNPQEEEDPPLDESKVELYSDIESVGDNTRDNGSDSEEEDQKRMVITADDQSLDTKLVNTDKTIDAIEPQSSDNCDQRLKDCPKVICPTLPTDSCVDNTNSSDKNDQKNQKQDKNSDKTQEKVVKKCRKPSIRDLFGDSDDEEEDDTDLRRLVAEQGGINVHYPIKMSIVLKNSIARKETIGSQNEQNLTTDQKSDEIPSSMQLLDSTPAPDLNRWVTVPPKDGIPVPDSTTTSAKGTANKWKAIESVDENPILDTQPEVQTSESNDNHSKPVEEMDVSEATSAPEVEDLEEMVNKLTTEETNLTENDLKSNLEIQTEEKLISDDPQSPTVAAEEEEGEIKDDDQKVRRCRHGRIRKDHKSKDREQRVESSKSCRHRSRSSESKVRQKDSKQTKDTDLGNKGIDCDVMCSIDSVVVDEGSPQTENVQFKEKTFERKDEESEELEEGAVGWKKPPKTLKNRSYRDGKPKDEEILFRERELQKKLVKKSAVPSKSKERDPTDRHQKSSDSKRQQLVVGEMSIPSEEATKQRKHRSETDKSDDNRRHKLKSEENKHKRRAADESTGRRTPPSVDDYPAGAQESKERHKRHHRSSRHKHRDSSGHKEGSDRLVSGGEGRPHRSHRSSKHSHHSSKSKSGTDGDGWPSRTPQKILRDHSSYADITPLDSKEIYAEGDRIVINVNFNREKNKKSLESTTGEDTPHGSKQSVDDSLDTRKSVIESKGRQSSKKDDSVFWASPPPTGANASTISGPNQSQSSSNPMTTTITRIEDDSNHSNRSSNSERKHSELTTKSSETIDSNKKEKPLEELRFLPRSLHQSDVRPLDSRPVEHTPIERPMGPHTPEGDYCEDQFMPTPTQDESQSPVRSPSLSPSSRSSPISVCSSPMTATNGSKDDVYDPEAPLQSPDQHQNKANNRRPDPKSPDVVVNSRKRSPQQLSRKRTSSSGPELKGRYSEPQRDSKTKSSPMGSTSHSVRSPFKSTSGPNQRQTSSKASPQKPVPSQHKSSSSLMPPPLAPTSRSTTAATLAATATAFASINPQNLAQLLQMAQVLNASKRQASAQAQQHQHRTHSSAGRQTSQPNSAQNNSNNRDHSKDHNEVVDMDVESPSPPNPQQPVLSSAQQLPRVSSTTGPTTTAQVKTLWEQIIKTTQSTGKPGISGQKRANSSSNAGTGGPPKKGRPDPIVAQKDRHQGSAHPHRHQVVSVSSDNKKQLTTSGNKLDQLTVLDDVPSSAVEMAVKEKFIKKLNRQERVIEEVKLVLKPYYQKRTVTKDEYKEILRKSVPKICHSRSGEINPVKIKSLIDGYIKRFKHLRKKKCK